MRQKYLALVATYLVACVTAATATVAVPQAIRVALGVLMVFVLPGLAAVGALFPEADLSFEDAFVATLGLSVAMSTCVAVALAALPVGLSRQSFAAAVGISTALLAVGAVMRSKPGTQRGARAD